MPDGLSIRPFQDGDKQSVRDLFILINRLIAPLGMEQQFEEYIVRSLAEEINHISEYYERYFGSFWVAKQNGMLKGMFWLEQWQDDDMELRCMLIPTLTVKGLPGKRLTDLRPMGFP